MCGRFALTISPEVLASLFKLDDVPELGPEFNISPGRDIAAIYNKSQVCNLSMLRWGLIPPWATDLSIGNRLINARSETIMEKPAFKDAFRLYRCLIPASGFYEWQKLPDRRQPWYFRLRDNEPMFLAGVRQTWTSPEGQIIPSCSIITTARNDMMQPVHHRMPLIISQNHFDLWLDCSRFDQNQLQKLLSPFPSDKMTAHQVSLSVNNPKNNAPKLIQPFSPPSQGMLF